MNDVFRMQFSDAEQTAQGLLQDAQALYDMLGRTQGSMNRLYSSGLQGSFLDEIQARASRIESALRYLGDETNEAGSDLQTVVTLARQLDAESATKFTTVATTNSRKTKKAINPTQEYIDYMGQFGIKQSGPSCSLTSQVMVLNALGIDVTVDDVANDAFWQAAISGYDRDIILNHYGVETEGYSQFWWLKKNEAAAVGWLNHRLNSNQPVLIGVEGDKLYRAVGQNDNNIPLEGHIVVVLGTVNINSTDYYSLLDPSTGTVTYSTREDFLDAWGARGYQGTATKDSVNIPSP
jgi:hypothetical protein